MMDSTDLLVSFVGPIQSVRETTQAIFNGPVKTVLLVGFNFAVAAAFNAAIDAFNTGQKQQGKMTSETLLQILGLALAVDFFE